MKKQTIYILMAAAVIAVVVFWLWNKSRKNQQPEFSPNFSALPDFDPNYGRSQTLDSLMLIAK